MTPRILIVSAAPPYVDPWHGLDDTTRRMSALLDGLSLEHEVVSDMQQAVERIPVADLLITNISGRPEAPDPHAAALGESLELLAANGGSILGMHSSAIAWSQTPQWAALLGAHWAKGRGGHPQIDRHVIHVAQGHAITEGIDDFRIYDERYMNLDWAADVTVLASHIEDGVRHPLVSVRALSGGGHAVYDALGHGSESFDSPEHRRLLARTVRWLLRLPLGDV